MNYSPSGTKDLAHPVAVPSVIFITTATAMAAKLSFTVGGGVLQGTATAIAMNNVAAAVSARMTAMR